jgi:hypothetical protein
VLLLLVSAKFQVSQLKDPPEKMENTTATDDDSTPTTLLFGWLWSLTTHRDRDLGPDATTYFQYEAAIAAFSILFFRLTVHKKSEPKAVSWFFGILLACLAHLRKSYELISAVELFSYAVSWLLLTQWPSAVKNNVLVRLAAIAASAAASLLLSNLLLSGKGTEFLMMVFAPKFVMRALNYMFPIAEFKAAYDIMSAFSHAEVLRKQVSHLFFVTFHIQVGMGFIGIDFLRQEQARRNNLIRLDLASGDEVAEDSANGTTSDNDHGPQKPDSVTAAKMARAKRFQRGAGPFILFAAFPYMLQIILCGNVNQFAFTCFEHDIHRSVRLNEIFEDHNNLAAMAADSATSPESTSSSY